MSPCGGRSSVPREVLLILIGCLLTGGCGKAPVPANSEAAPKSQASSSAPATRGESAPPAVELKAPPGFSKRTVDLDELAKLRGVRALVMVNPIGFFYQAGKPRGIQYEALQEFEKFLNEKMKTGKLRITVAFLPMRPDQIEAALTQGVGDIIAQALVVTPERAARFAFSTPIQEHVSEVVVTGADLANVNGFEGLADKAIYVNPLTTYYENLKKLSDAQTKAGKPPLNIKAADKNLLDDDLIEMVNAGLIPATVTTQARAELWAQVLPNVKSHADLAIATELETAWVMRKNNPKLKAVVDEFVQTHAAGTSFGNTLLRRYLQNTKWIRNSTSAEELKKFNSYVQFFQKYANEYNFDYLLIAAQGYQESLLDQDKKSHLGAVGVMQVMPKLAAADPIRIPNVGIAEDNIHAGVKMLRNIADNYFNDPGIDPLNKTLFTFASYNAGPNRIARLRKKAEEDGLNQNIWFGNVELEVAKDVGQETVNYVGNIYKYYVAYKLAVEEKNSVSGAADAR